VTSLVGTGQLVRLALRRDRWRLPIWIVALTVMVPLVGLAFEDLYPTVEARVRIAGTIGLNPALQAVLGPIFDATTIGGLVAWRMSFLSMVLVPVMALLAVVRHTRAEEETGRLELLGSTVMGRRAPLTAALIVACGASTVLGAAVAASMLAIGEAGVGSVALGLSYALAGCVFAGVAAVAVQLTESSRGATGIAVGVLGVSYALRGVGDASAEAGLSWLSWAPPVGWIIQIRPFGDERWWVAGLLAAATLALVLVADVLVARRDLGGGLVPPRPGPAEASRWLGGSLGLAWRLHRAPLLGWAFGLFALGAMYGGVAAGVGDLLTDSPELEEIFRRVGGTQALMDAFFATTMAIAGLITSGYVIHATLRLRQEETGLRAEQVLSTGVGRTPWALSHLAVAALGGIVLLVAAGLGSGLTHGLRVGDLGGEIPRLVAAALVHLPAVLVLAGLALALFGLAPRATPVAWAALVAFLVLGQLGPILQLDQWLMNLSPFTHVPGLPGEDVAATPLFVLAAAATALAAAGLAGFRLRDVG
jgi:ABC-2 type transport system permease protein